MKAPYVLALTALIAFAQWAKGQSSEPTAPRTVVVPSGNLRLKAFLWMPAGRGPFPAVLFCHGSGGVDAEHTGGFEIREAAQKLGPEFVKHGYAFLYLFRRGHGPSADQAPFMQDVLKREEAEKGVEARKAKQLLLLTTDYLEDELAALSYLKRLAGIDARRIAVVGHSFGGQLALIAAEKDTSVRAAVVFGAAAASWNESPELRALLLTAVRATNAPIMIVHAANDYSVAPGKALATELERLGKPHLLKIYPPAGSTADDGHNFVYTGVPEWQRDVFRFLDLHVRHR